MPRWKKPVDRHLNEAQTELVLANLRLVWWQAGKLSRRFALDREGCTDTALDALWDAARLFDPARGVKFSTYATRAIVRQVLRYRKLQLRRADRAALSLCAQSAGYGRRCVEHWGESPLAPMTEDAASPSERAEEQHERRRLVRLALAAAGNCAETLRLRFFCGLTLREIGKRLGVSREAIRQQQQSGLARARLALAGP